MTTKTKLAGLTLAVVLLAGCAFWRGLLGLPNAEGESAGQHSAGQAVAAAAQTLVPPPFSQGIAVLLGLAAAFENYRQRSRAGERDVMIRAAQDVKETLGGASAHIVVDAIKTQAGDSGVVASLHAAYKKLFPVPGPVAPAPAPGKP